MQGILHSAERCWAYHKFTFITTNIEQLASSALQFHAEILVIVTEKKCQIEKLELCIQEAE